ncbi:hypothetical protein L0666_14340 [Octadecabacter sp. CECT 8868]|uniref:hypothetical protein n=1 Tax=Octadecabacter algicola TaxID=2909342 RepID=UPI001F367A04|nr:hypothetical protein [Octadecabacter algicola]MCF2906171.1 hypothetical protein [Octadecabacter algicola]
MLQLAQTAAFQKNGKENYLIARLSKTLLQRIYSLDFLIDTAAVLVLPAVMFSFWRFSERDEYADLRASGQKLNLNTGNLRSAYRRNPDDPLRVPHIKLARIGFFHWVAIPVGFSTVLVIGVVLKLIQRSLS